MKTIENIRQDCELAKTLAAEDIRRGDVVAILDMIYEYPSFLWSTDCSMLPPGEPICIRFHADNFGRPLKVQAICLPYVLVKTPRNECHTIDVRRCRLVRLSDSYAQKAWKNFRKKRKKKNSND